MIAPRSRAARFGVLLAWIQAIQNCGRRSELKIRPEDEEYKKKQ